MFLLGILLERKGIKVMDIERERCFLSRDVVFHSEIFPLFPLTAEHTSDDSHEISSPNETLSAQDERLFFNLQNCSASKTIL